MFLLLLIVGVLIAVLIAGKAWCAKMPEKRAKTMYKLKNSVCAAVLGTGLLISSVAHAAVTVFSEDFEATDASSTSALSDSGWKVFYNVYDGDSGVFLFGFGFFPAPNATASGINGFSAIVAGEGDAAQGAQQLSVFSDYQNPSHLSSDLVETFVQQNFVIDADDVDQTWVFRFDYKKGDLVSPSTSAVFVQTVDPASGFVVTNYVSYETSDAPDSWSTQSEIYLTIEPGMVGSFLQFGFVTTATDNDPSSIFYDNLEFFAAADTDGDGIPEVIDNCIGIANADQSDSNGDGFGNLCDADLNNDCIVNMLDLAIMGSVFLSNDADADLDGSGTVNFIDVAIFRAGFLLPPGPSGTPKACD